MPMNRWIWPILAAVILVAIGVFIWPSAHRTTEAPPAAQAPAAAPPVQPATKEAAGAGSAAQTSEQKSPPAPAAQSAEKKTAPAPAQEPAAAPAAQSAEKKTAPAPAQEPAAAPAAQSAERKTAPAPAQEPAAAPAAQSAEKKTAPAPAQEPAAAPAAQSAEKETAPADQDADLHANDKANAELVALQPGFVPKDLIAALNDSVVNFPSDSAEVPASMIDFLQKAAEDIKQLPNGHVVEIAGYTDNTGEQALNVALSQKRAEAVRQMLVKFGAEPEMLIAKGYGSADPVASNDTPEGRRRNRRIEYHIVKAP
jgi:outer membrane protein OmpA-like peptidoglycan-associated protein